MKLLAPAVAAPVVLRGACVSGQAQAGPGDLYVADYDNSMIEWFTPGGVASVFATTGLNSPRGRAFEPALATTAVPEPAPLAVLGMAMAGLGLIRRKWGGPVNGSATL